jgi:hypothetical protein
MTAGEVVRCGETLCAAAGVTRAALPDRVHHSVTMRAVFDLPRSMK